MATALQSLRITARCCSCRSITSRYTNKPIASRRLFSITSRQYKIDPKFKELEETEPDEYEFMEEIDDLFENAGARHANNLPSYGFDEGVKKKLKPTFLNMGDPEPFDEDDREDDHDDITTLAHMELEQVREIRHYNRLAAWEMPMLSSEFTLHLLEGTNPEQGFFSNK
jgi:small subunit ribosomal protein S35